MGYALGYLIRLILQLLLRWHESEKRQQEDREWEVRERNRRRKRALQGDTSAPVSEDAWRDGPGDAEKEDKSLSGQADARFKRRVQKLNLERKPGKSVGLIASTTLVYGFIGFLCLVGFCALGTIVVCLGAPMALPRASPGKQAQAPNSPPPKEQPKPPDVKKPAEQPPKEQPKPKEPARFVEGPPPGVAATDDHAVLAGKTTVAGDVEFTDVNLRTDIWADWTADKRGIYVLRCQEGTLARVAADGLVTQRSVRLGKECRWAAVSGPGILVVVPGEEIWLLDADSLDVKLRIAVPGLLKVFSRPSMTRAFATRKDHTVVTLDLVMKRANSEDPFVRNSMDWAVATPSEMFLLTAGGSAPVIHRYDINGRFQHDETGPVAPDGFLVGGVSLSGDGQYVCLSGGVVNLDVPHPRPDAGRSETKIYAVRDLKKPAFVLRADAPLRGVAFDPERKKIYSTDGPNLLVFDDKGELTKTYPRAPDSQNTTACLFNPVRRQVLLTGADRFSLVAWRP